MKRVNIAAPEFDYDEEDPDGFRAGMFRFGKLIGAKRLGATVYELPPGQSICPYRYEYGDEEWLLVALDRHIPRGDRLPGQREGRRLDGQPR